MCVREKDRERETDRERGREGGHIERDSFKLTSINKSQCLLRQEGIAPKSHTHTHTYTQELPLSPLPHKHSTHPHTPHLQYINQIRLND